MDLYENKMLLFMVRWILKKFLCYPCSIWRKLDDRLQQLEYMISDIRSDECKQKRNESIENSITKLESHISSYETLIRNTTCEVNAQLSFLAKILHIHEKSLNRVMDTIEIQSVENHIENILFKLQLAQTDVDKMSNKVGMTSTRLEEVTDQIHVMHAMKTMHH